ncbi:MMPL family transporter [Demequina sp. SYSU T00039]|uniref:MMPL family transporter n=1 Tax=Demequina lignilytica TaxID=3051663 RepID=A0AAW7M693_9MICO|nr:MULTISPECIES: MMPL family transporter [unclassified Demequina]MDN4478902.1 MMPL family transporter [Demequina sp. SYSU T00039-1]MDN4488777.1 MMPL family transporter [Demequina sp. SYSU T00039]MDN4491839.1 MMPL family transporter [Demequina sp. SYSU T00068]
MAHLLYRIGRAAALRPIVAIVAWLLALGVAGGSFVAFGGTLTDSFSIPGLETEKVTEQLTEEIPELAGGSSRAVFQTVDGEPFTAEQEQAVTEALAAAETVDSVTGVVDPFATQAQLEAQAAQLADAPQQIADAQAQLDAGQEQLDAGQAQLDAARAELEAGQAQLDAAIQQAQDAGTYELAKEQLDAQQAQLDAGLAQLDEQQATIDAQQQQIDDGLAELQAQTEQLDLGAQLAEAASGITTVSEDGTTALGIIQFDASVYEVVQEDKDAVIEAVREATPEDVTVNFSADIATSVEGVMGAGEIVGVLLAFVVLMVMMRAIWPALLPIVTSVLGVGVGVATALAFSGVVEMSSVSPILGVMLALAVGIDYSLFIVNRHRQQYKRGMDLHESIGLANGTSGNAVVFAGSTVIVALLALNITGIPFLGIMGSVGAFCVGIAVLIAVTLTPAALGLIGHRVLGRKARATIGAPEHAEAPVKPMRTGRALLRFTAAVVGLAVIAIPAMSMRLGLPDGTQEPQDSTQYIAYKTVDQKFGEGLNGTLLVTADLPEAVADEDLLAAQVAVVNALMADEDVAAVAPAGSSADNSFLAFQVIPQEGPSSETTVQLVSDLRELSPLDDGTVIGVAGEASGNIDVSEKLDAALPVYLAIVVGLSIIILIVVFRSLIVPLIATLGFVLSLFAAFGMVTAVFQWGWLGSLFGVHDPGPILSFLPILLTGILFGLAMDYQLFLTTGMREAYVHGLDARRSVVAGLRHGRAVVTAAAIIMVSVFGGFIFSHIAMIRPMGFGLAMGVLFDAFVVRMVIVPSLMHLVGEKAWWLPAWLDRILPNVDVEGSALEREHPVPHAEEESEAATA